MSSSSSDSTASIIDRVAALEAKFALSVHEVSIAPKKSIDDIAHSEDHGGAGSSRVKSIVFGGLDGVITTFSIVAAVAGANLPPQTAILMGFSNLIADALSMGLGDFLSSKAELEFEISESNREKLEFEKSKDAEVAEHARMLVERGVTEADAIELSNILSKYPDVFHEMHMPLELGIGAPDDEATPAMDGFTTFMSFIIFGSVPMWTYIVLFYGGVRNWNHIFGASCAMTAATLFLLGWVQATITRQARFKTATLMMINGGLAAAAAYLVGWGLEHAVGTGV
jgi:VIT1/CCC1 family predicted Fe2+/Mn2+ transporter